MDVYTRAFALMLENLLRNGFASTQTKTLGVNGPLGDKMGIGPYRNIYSKTITRVLNNVKNRNYKRGLRIVLLLSFL